MTLQQLREKRSTLLGEAKALRQADGTFANDEARGAFDAKMAEIEGLDGQIRALEPAAPAAAQPQTPAPAADPAEAARAEERKRVTDLQAIATRAGLGQAFVTQHINAGTTADAARSAAFEALAARNHDGPTPTGNRIAVGEDAFDKMKRGVTGWILQRTGTASLVAEHEKVAAVDPGEFRGMSLLDLARTCLERAGVATRGMDRMTLAGVAMSHRSNFQTTSDFTNLLENALHKVLQAQYAITPDTWSKFCGIGSVSDFRSHIWHRLAAFSAFDDLSEHAEFKNKAIPDSERATFSASTKGNIIAITRQVIVNDDLGFVVRLAQGLGRAGKLTIEKAVYTELAKNSGLGPTMSDSNPLFHSSRANVGTGAAISAAAIDADRVLMKKQQEPGSQEYLDLAPSVLLVPVELESTARVINDSQYDPDSLGSGSKAVMRPNPAGKVFSTIVGSARVSAISTTRRYLFADPNVAPVFLVAFLDGQQEPVLEQEQEFRIDGVAMKARLDVGVNVVDYRGTVTNAGA